MSGWSRIGEWIQGINRGICFAGMFLLIPMMLITSADVAGRVLWTRPIPGSVELSSYMLAVFILFGVAYTHQVKGYVAVSALTSRLPGRVRAALEVVTILLSILVIGVLAWQGWVVGMEERTVSDMLRIPQRPFRLLVSVAAFLLCLELLIDLVRALRSLVRG